jgi:hypothetical protein
MSLMMAMVFSSSHDGWQLIYEICLSKYYAQHAEKARTKYVEIKAHCAALIA